MTETPEIIQTPSKRTPNYQKQLKGMSDRQLRDELKQFIPGTRRNRKRVTQPDNLSIAYAAVLSAFLDSHESGRPHWYVR